MATFQTHLPGLSVYLNNNWHIKLIKIKNKTEDKKGKVLIIKNEKYLSKNGLRGKP